MSDTSALPAPDAPGPITRIDRWLQPFENIFNLIASLAIFALMVLGVLQIGLRSIFNKPIVGYIDLVELSMAAMAFLGAAYCQRLGAHIRMEYLVGKLKGRWLWSAECIATCVALFIVGVLIWYGWGHFLRAYQIGDTTIDAEYQVWPSKLLVPLAFGLWFLRLSLQLAGSIRLVINPDLAPEGVVTIKDVAEQAQDEIHEAFGDDTLLDGSTPADPSRTEGAQ